MARPSRIVQQELVHPVTLLLQREWVWARLATHWRLYRSGYHLHARSTWRRARPQRRQEQHAASPRDLHLLLARRVVRSEEDTMDAQDWQALEEIQEQMQQAAQTRQGQVLHTEETPTHTPSELRAPPASLMPPEVALRAAERAASRARTHEWEAACATESYLLSQRTHFIGQKAEQSLLVLLSEADAATTEFQRSRLRLLSEELAPPNSSAEEQLLAAVVAKARFEKMLWSVLASALLQSEAVSETSVPPGTLTGSALAVRGEHSHPTHPLQNQAAEFLALLDRRERQAHKRYLQALQELSNLRNLDAPLPSPSLLFAEG